MFGHDFTLSCISTSHGRVTRIDLNDNYLVGTLPSELQVLTKLTDLLVDHNDLSGAVRE